jgi:hypothetical protein
MNNINYAGNRELMQDSMYSQVLAGISKIIIFINYSIITD